MAIPCPVCDAAIDIDEDELAEGDSVSCDECGAELLVSSLEPLELEPADEEDEEDDEDAADLDEDEEEEEEDETWK